MVEDDQAQRTVKVKIADDGPALGGKTTNLKVLRERAKPERRSDLVSVNSEQDRTILCDLLPLTTGGFRGFDLSLRLLAMPGQTTYAAPRRAVLKGSDGSVFVRNSAVDRWHENLRSFQEPEAAEGERQVTSASTTSTRARSRSYASTTGATWRRCWTCRSSTGD